MERLDAYLIRSYWKLVKWLFNIPFIMILYAIIVYLPLSIIFRNKAFYRYLHPQYVRRYATNRLEKFNEYSNKQNNRRIRGKRSIITSIRSRVEWLSTHCKSVEALEAEKKRLVDIVFVHLEKNKEQIEKEKGFMEACVKILDTIDINTRIEAIALASETMCRIVDIEEMHDNQLVAATFMTEERFIELRNGEGKTFIAVPVLVWASIRLQALKLFSSKYETEMPFDSCYLVTSNDYLVRRDFARLSKVYESLGITVSYIESSEGLPSRHRTSYQAEIVFITGSKLVFDYLRNNSRNMGEEPLSRFPYFVLIDEADQLLIDEARTPHILSGHQSKRFSAYVESSWVRQLDIWVATIFKKNTLIDKSDRSHYGLTTAGRIYFRALLEEYQIDSWTGLAKMTQSSGIKHIVLLFIEFILLTPTLNKQLDQDVFLMLNNLLDAEKNAFSTEEKMV